MDDLTILYDGFRLCLYLIIINIMMFGQFKVGNYVVTDNKTIKWIIVIIYFLGCLGVIVRYV